MTIEDERERRGEPVTITVRGKTLLGTIEWGNDRRGYSVMTEPAGARCQVARAEVISDPGGDRPLWSKRQARRLDTMTEDEKAARALIRRAIGHLRAAEGHARKGEWGDMRHFLELGRETMGEAEGVADEINEPR